MVKTTRSRCELCADVLSAVQRRRTFGPGARRCGRRGTACSRRSMRCTRGSRGGTGSCARTRPRSRAFVFQVPDGAAGVPAAGVGAEAARVGATRSVMSYIIDGAKLDPKMRVAPSPSTTFLFFL